MNVFERWISTKDKESLHQQKEWHAYSNYDVKRKRSLVWKIEGLKTLWSNNQNKLESKSSLELKNTHILKARKNNNRRNV